VSIEKSDRGGGSAAMVVPETGVDAKPSASRLRSVTHPGQRADRVSPAGSALAMGLESP